MLLPTLRRSHLAAAALACISLGAQAQDAERLKQLERKLDDSVAIIQQLQKRLQELESRQAPAAPAPAAPTAPAADTTSRLEAVERSVSEISAQAARPADTGVPIHGFFDVGWAQSSSRAPASQQNGARLGAFDIYITPQISANVKALVELAFETGPDSSLATDLERLQLGYVFSDALTLWGGRFHTPYGYWNTAYHHGAQIQTALTRPRFLAFEDQGGILPAHSVGLWASGRTRSALGKVTYDLYAVNGNRIDAGILNFNSGGDNNKNVGTGLNVSLSPTDITGLTLGLHAMSQRVEGTNAAGNAAGGARMQFAGGYAFYESDRWELLGEYYRFANKDLSGGTGTQNSWAGFVQAGVHLDDRWTVYGRTERTSLSALDPYFSLQESGTSYRRVVAGARYELDPRTALKVEWDRMDDSANTLGAFNTVRAQYAVRF